MQREEALRNGDYVKAEILNRPAEKYIGTVASYDKNNPKVRNLLQCRRLNSIHEQLLLAAEEVENR